MLLYSDQSFGVCTKSTGVCNYKGRFNTVTEHGMRTVAYLGLPSLRLLLVQALASLTQVPCLPNITNVTVLGYSCVLNKHPSWYVYLFSYLFN